MAKKKYTYIPQDEIESISTWNGKEIKGSDLLDGAYVRGTKKYAGGGQIEMLDREIKKAKRGLAYFEEQGMMTEASQLEDYILDLQSQRAEMMGEPRVTRQVFEEEMYEYAEGGEIMKKAKFKILNPDTSEIIKEYSIDYKDGKELNSLFKEAKQVYDEYLVEVETDTFVMSSSHTYKEEFKMRKYSDGGMMKGGGYMAKGGVTRNRKKSLDEKAENIVGKSTWHSLDKDTQAGVISEMISEGVLPQRMAKGSVVSDKMSVTFTFADGKKEVREYSSKEDMDEGIADMYVSFDIEDVKINEPKKEKKSLFAAAKESTTASKPKGKAGEVEVDGLGPEIARYNELDAIIKNAEAEKEILSGRLYEVGKDKFMELYLQNRQRPKNFNLTDDGEQILFMVFDKYKKVTPEKEEILKQYDDVLGVDIKYVFDNKTLEKTGKNGENIGDIINDLIQNSDDISEQDKENLLIVEKKVGIKKGMIDRLLEYDNPEEIFQLIDVIVGLK